MWDSKLPSDALPSALNKVSPAIPPELRPAPPATFGRLTSSGVQQLCAIGASLRTELIETSFLPDFLDPALIEVRSTSFSRTLQSAQALLLGLYPPEAREPGVVVPVQLDESLHEQMIPDLKPTMPELEALARFGRCTDFQELEAATKPSRDRARSALLASGLLDEAYADGAEGSAPDRLLSWGKACEVLTCLEAHGDGGLLAAGVDPRDARDVRRFDAWRWFAQYSHPCGETAARGVGALTEPRDGPLQGSTIGINDEKSLGRVAMDDFIIRLTEQLVDAAVDGEIADAGEQRLFVYSAHDSTLVALLCAMGLETRACTSAQDNDVLESFLPFPEYGALLRLELWQKSSRVDDGSMGLAAAAGDPDHSIVRIRYASGGSAAAAQEGDLDVRGQELWCGSIEELVHRLLRQRNGLRE
jgi:hypothetical protein